MNDYLELFRKELSEVACFKEKTVKLYVSIVCGYADYFDKMLKINPLESKTRHVNEWFSYLRAKGESNHFLKCCKASLGHFFSLLVKSGCMKENPAESLAPVRIPKSVLNKPISQQSAFALLHAFDRSMQMGMRNFTIVSGTTDTLPRACPERSEGSQVNADLYSREYRISRMCWRKLKHHYPRYPFLIRVRLPLDSARGEPGALFVVPKTYKFATFSGSVR